MHCSCEGFKQFRDSTDVVVEIGWIAVVRRKLLKGQQNLVCFKYRRGIVTAKLWLTRGARLLLFSWRSTRGAVGNLFLRFCHHVRVLVNLLWSSCHHVRVVFCLWAVHTALVVRRVPHFGAGIVWGTIPRCSSVFPIIVPRCSRNGYGTSPNLWVQKKLVQLWQGTQDTWLCSIKIFWQFLGYSALDLLGNLGVVILVWFGVKRVLSSTVSSVFRCFSRNCC